MHKKWKTYFSTAIAHNRLHSTDANHSRWTWISNLFHVEINIFVTFTANIGIFMCGPLVMCLLQLCGCYHQFNKNMPGHILPIRLYIYRNFNLHWGISSLTESEVQPCKVFWDLIKTVVSQFEQIFAIIVGHISQPDADRHAYISMIKWDVKTH